MDIKKYSSLLVGVIVEDISYAPSRSYGDEYLSVEEWFIMMNEFLIYDLHICDRFLFARWGNDLREKLMKEIMELISKRMEEVRDQILNNQLKNLSVEKFPQYLQTLRSTPTREWVISSFNQRQIELRPYKLIKEYPKNDTWDGLLEWEFAKKLAALLGKEQRKSFVLALWTQSMGILPKFAKTEVPEEEVPMVSGDGTRQSRLIFIKNHAKANVTDRSWMPLLILICIIINIFVRMEWLKIFNIGMLLWMFLAAADSFFKTKEAGLIMRSKPMANLSRASIFLVAISILSIILVSFDHFILALACHSINILILFATSYITNRNIEVFLNNRAT
ncbi:MAG: hypothetical protein HZA27_02330 [Candidatus Omnitrophica bacterium]|nr:hypothetical protein [Candidatus Omnitrophota bacterium]